MRSAGIGMVLLGNHAPAGGDDPCGAPGVRTHGDEGVDEPAANLQLPDHRGAELLAQIVEADEPTQIVGGNRRERLAAKLAERHQHRALSAAASAARTASTGLAPRSWRPRASRRMSQYKSTNTSATCARS